jgi:hypothetical protein
VGRVERKQLFDDGSLYNRTIDDVVLAACGGADFRRRIG